MAEPNGNGSGAHELPPLAEIDEPPPPAPEPLADQLPETARPDRSRTRSLPQIEPDPMPGAARSRFDPDLNSVLYNERHSDYLLVKDDDTALLDYLATLVAKEYVVYNNPRAPADELTEEMVRIGIRVRRHLPRRR